MVAESDTGGVLLDWLTAVPGSSRVALGGVVAYHDDLKRSLLGVDPGVIERHGAVSAPVAEAMAEGMRRVCRCRRGAGHNRYRRPGRRDANQAGRSRLRSSRHRRVDAIGRAPLAAATVPRTVVPTRSPRSSSR